MKLKTSKVKPKMEPELRIIKKQRTKRSRRLRSQISPILISDLNSLSPRKNKAITDFSADASSCLQFGDELSSNSSRVTIESNARKRKLCEPRGRERNEDLRFRRITRSYYNLKEDKRKRNEVEVSESSCVESNSGLDFVASENKSSKLKKRTESGKENRVSGTSTLVNEPEICSVKRYTGSGSRNLEKFSSDVIENDAISVASDVDSCLSHRASKEAKNREPETEHTDILKTDAVSIKESSVEQNQKTLGIEADLACAEHFSFDDAVSDDFSSHGTAFSELQTELFAESSSELEFLDYTPSIFLDSGSEFSVKSDDSPPSRTYSFLLEFRRQFSRSNVALDTRKPSLAEAECLEHFTFVSFVDEDDEESYQRFRERERRQLFLHNYVDFYRSTTEYGDLIFQQRLQMVHWILEQSSAKELQHETMFLGVNLLDRFLSKGFFKTKRNLQIAGIACLVLATRIEENQPYNSVRQKNFHTESNAYTRAEVVAMEWLVQEVLSFQCFLPTIHNFMWFYLKAARADAKVERRARYLARLALSDYEHLRHWPSTVAASLVILASLESDQVESYRRVIEVHIRKNENDLHECIKTLEWLLQYVS